MKAQLKKLQQLNWINNHTRAVFLEFAVYNANVNLFGIATIIAEFIPGGGIIPFWRIDPITLLHHHNPDGGFILFAEILFGCFTLWFTMKELIQLKRRGFAEYFQDYWSWGEWTIIIAGYISAALYCFRLFLTRDILETFAETKGKLMHNKRKKITIGSMKFIMHLHFMVICDFFLNPCVLGNGYIRLQYVAMIDEYYTYMTSYIYFISFVKFIRLLRFNNMFAMLMLTLKTAWEDLVGFFGVFFLIFFAFVQMFYIILFTQLYEFATTVKAFETCFTMLLGRFKFGTLKETSMTVRGQLYLLEIH